MARILPNPQFDLRKTSYSLRRKITQRVVRGAISRHDSARNQPPIGDGAVNLDVGLTMVDKRNNIAINMTEVKEMNSRRWLIIFAVIIGVLAITTVSLVLLTKENQAALLPGDTPQGVVQRYLIAVREQDYREAYGYLSFDPSQKIVTYDDWLRRVGGTSRPYQATWKATLGKTTQNGDNASVEVSIDTFRPEGPFADPVRNQLIVFQLAKIGGKWLITSPIYIYWIY